MTLRELALKIRSLCRRPKSPRDIWGQMRRPRALIAIQQVPHVLDGPLILLSILQQRITSQHLRKDQICQDLELHTCIGSIMNQTPVSWYDLPSFLSCLCLCPAPSPSPSDSIQPHLPAFHCLRSNSEAYLCNYATSMLRLALD